MPRTNYEKTYNGDRSLRRNHTRVWKNNYLNIYNNLIKLTRNKLLYKNIIINESFYDRLIIFLFLFGFFLKINKKISNKDEFQKLYDYIFYQIELSIREIGYGDSTVNKKMKEYVNLLYKLKY